MSDNAIKPAFESDGRTFYKRSDMFKARKRGGGIIGYYLTREEAQRAEEEAQREFIESETRAIEALESESDALHRDIAGAEATIRKYAWLVGELKEALAIHKSATRNAKAIDGALAQRQARFWDALGVESGDDSGLF